MKLRDSSRGDPVGFVVAVAVLRRSGQQLAAQGFTAGEIVFQGIEQDFGRKLPRFEHLPLQDGQAVGRVRHAEQADGVPVVFRTAVGDVAPAFEAGRGQQRKGRQRAEEALVPLLAPAVVDHA